MVLRPRSRPGTMFRAMIAVTFLITTAPAALATMLDDASCQRLRTERQALTVLGIDKVVEKGADWAKEKLTVADLNLVKRYFDVFEQLKFRCEKLVAAVELEEKDEDEENGAGALKPPMPQRKSAAPAKSEAAPAARKTDKGSANTSLKATNASAIQVGPAQLVPVR